MTADDSTHPDGENVTDGEGTERWKYAATGHAHATGEHFHGQFDEADAKVWVERTLEPRLNLSLIYGDGTPEVQVLALLSPEQARSLACDLIEWASEIENAYDLE